MTVRMICARVLLAIFALFAAAPALAQSGGVSYDPTGIWELRVGGSLEGARVNGIAYVEFDSQGGVAGYFMSRLSAEVFDVQGAWFPTGNRFTGSIEVTADGVPVASLAIGGLARSGRSIAARLTDSYGSSVSLAGKPLVAMPNLSGTYSGTLQQYGLVGSIYLTLTADGNGAYIVQGTLYFNGASYNLYGYVLVTRSGSFVAYVRNLTLGYDSGLWGKFTPNSLFIGSGRSLYDQSPLRVRLSRNG